MTEVIVSKPQDTTCRECGAPIFHVTMWSGKKTPINKKRVIIINKIKEDVWTTTSGYTPHEMTCPKGGEQHENHD